MYLFPDSSKLLHSSIYSLFVSLKYIISHVPTEGEFIASCIFPCYGNVLLVKYKQSILKKGGRLCKCDSLHRYIRTVKET